MSAELSPVVVLAQTPELYVVSFSPKLSLPEAARYPYARSIPQYVKDGDLLPAFKVEKPSQAHAHDVQKASAGSGTTQLFGYSRERFGRGLDSTPNSPEDHFRKFGRLIADHIGRPLSSDIRRLSPQTAQAIAHIGALTIDESQYEQLLVENESLESHASRRNDIWWDGDIVRFIG